MRIIGPPGIGKSALARHTVTYIQERGFIQGGCIYVNCRWTSEFQDLLAKLITRMEHDSSGWLDIDKTNKVSRRGSFDDVSIHSSADVNSIKSQQLSNK